MGTYGAGRPAVSEQHRLVDQLEESLLAIREAQARFDEAEALEEAAMKELRAAEQAHEALLQRYGYRHATVAEFDQQLKQTVRRSAGG